MAYVTYHALEEEGLRKEQWKDFCGILAARIVETGVPNRLKTVYTQSPHVFNLFLLLLLVAKVTKTKQRGTFGFPPFVKSPSNDQGSALDPFSSTGCIKKIKGRNDSFVSAFNIFKHELFHLNNFFNLLSNVLSGETVFF